MWNRISLKRAPLKPATSRSDSDGSIFKVSGSHPPVFGRARGRLFLPLQSALTCFKYVRISKAVLGGTLMKFQPSLF